MRFRGLSARLYTRHTVELESLPLGWPPITIKVLRLVGPPCDHELRASLERDDRWRKNHDCGEEAPARRKNPLVRVDIEFADGKQRRGERNDGSRESRDPIAVLQRRLQGKPPCSDLFGVKGRQWLAGLELPLEERESVDAA